MDRRTLLKTAVAVPAAATLVAADPASALGAPRAIATGLDIPWGLDFLPDHSALVTERDSTRLLRLRKRGGAQVIGTVPGVAPAGEGGLLGLAVSPRFRRDRRVYLYFSTASDNRVAWAQLKNGVLGPLTPIVTGIPRGQIHNGGSLLFTHAGTLLVGCGETGNTALAQNPGSLGGKVLRVNRNGAPVRGNPYVGGGGDPRIFTLGHRNPQGLAQRPDRAAIWSAELGQNTYDELNRLRLGNNYGWPIAEGTDGPGGYTDPFVQWTTAECSPSGVAIAKDRAWVGALRGESLWSVELTGPNAGRKVRHFQGTYGRIRNVKRAPDGSLWFTTSNGNHADQVVRVRI